jgi:hypothetical protein
MFSHVKRLSSVSLLVEVVHKILTDIQLVRILHILCGEPYVEACVTSHYDIGKVLPAERLLPRSNIIKLHRHSALDRPHIVPLERERGKGIRQTALYPILHLLS